MASRNIDDEVWRLCANDQGVNLTNLFMLQTELSINDMHDAAEAHDVAISWATAAEKNLREQK